MPQRSTLEYVADLIIRQTMSMTSDPADLEAALLRAYPFADDPTAYQVWVDALRDKGINCTTPDPSATRPVQCSE
jgi:hypothetical protein